MRRGNALAANAGTAGRFRGRGGVQVPAALSEAPQGCAFGVLTNLDPGIVFGNRNRCGGSVAAPETSGRRLRVDASRVDLTTA